MIKVEYLFTVRDPFSARRYDALVEEKNLVSILYEVTEHFSTHPGEGSSEEEQVQFETDRRKVMEILQKYAQST